MKKKLTGWGVTRFAYTRDDVQTCLDILEHNRGLHGDSVATVVFVMDGCFKDKKRRDGAMLTEWVEKIIHLKAAGVENIPSFICDATNPYRTPATFCRCKPK